MGIDPKDSHPALAPIPDPCSPLLEDRVRRSLRKPSAFLGGLEVNMDEEEVVQLLGVQGCPSKFLAHRWLHGDLKRAASVFFTPGWALCG